MARSLCGGSHGLAATTRAPLNETTENRRESCSPHTIIPKQMDSVRFRFGLFEFDCAARELRRDGALVRLQAQPALALACLLERNGQVVTREELCQAIWGEATHVDFERGLNFCIAQIRAALEDDSASPRFIRTIPKRGYQFIAPAEETSPADEPADAITGGPRISVRVIATVCALLLVVAAALGVGYWVRSRMRPVTVPIVAVVRFDAAANDPAAAEMIDGLTDNVVAELTTQSHDKYRVIGNAAILRVPRGQRDLQVIGSSLHADYLVMGQVQSNGSRIHILAHLIRVPALTHIWVDRIDGTVGDALGTELQSAKTIATDFSQRVIKDSSGSPLPPFPNH